MRFPGGKPKAITLSYDDGVAEDIRFIELMKQYGLDAESIANRVAIIQNRETPDTDD